MEERTGVFTFKGKPLTLIGPELQVGDRAPQFALLANDLSVVKLSDSRGKVRLLSVVTSLDTSTCSIQTKRFNEELPKLGPQVVAYTISCDLPFAQARFCGAEGISNMQVLSDHREVSFGQAYGVLIKELRLLARSVFVVGGDDRIRYVRIEPEGAQEPDYEPALGALQAALK